MGPYPLQAYLNQNLGPPFINKPGLGGDALGALAALAAMDDMGAWGRPGGGRPGGGGGGHPFARIIQALRQRGFQVLPPMRPRYGEDFGADPDMGADLDVGGDGDGLGADTLDVGDAAELGAIDDDLAADEAAGEDVGAMGGEVGADEMGADLSAINTRLFKLTQLLQKVENKLENTPRWKRAKRKHLSNRLSIIRNRIRKVESQRIRRAERISAKSGVPVAALLAGGAAGAAAGGAAALNAERLMNRAAGQAALNIHGVNERQTPAGEEIRIPFVDGVTGSPVVTISVPVGLNLRTASISMVTQAITYADFEVVGIDTDLRLQQANNAGGFPLAQILSNLLISSVIVGGSINLLYQQINAAMGAQTTNGQLTCARTIPGIRASVPLEATNTATLAATFRQEISNDAAINGTFQAALICRRTKDRMASRVGV